MPLSEFYQLAKGKLESSQQKPTTYSTDPSSMRNGNHTIRRSHSVSILEGVDLEQGSVLNVSLRSGDPKGSTNNHMYPLPPQECQTSSPSCRSRGLDFINIRTGITTQNSLCNNSVRNQSSSLVHPSIMMQKQDPGSCILNFSHFSRPAALFKANLESIGAGVTHSPSSVQNKSKGSAVTNGSPIASTLVNSSSFQRKDMGSNSQPTMVPATDESKLLTGKQYEEPHTAEQFDAIGLEDAFQTDKSSRQVVGSSMNKLMVNGVKATENVVASSVCSGNSMESASDAPTHNFKRKRTETEDSEYLSEDDEEELAGINKTATARGAQGPKRNRAAEVHNLSERRRRDRINEKMRSLQELIPNCNKMMSMGTGLCMPLMYPAGMQLMHATHIPRFRPMGVGMGMAMGFGMSMPDLRSGSPGSPAMQMPPVPPISGPSNLHKMAGSNLSMFGIHGQGMPISMPHPQSVPYSAVHPMKTAMVADASGPRCPI